MQAEKENRAPAALDEGQAAAGDAANPLAALKERLRTFRIGASTALQNIPADAISATPLASRQVARSALQPTGAPFTPVGGQPATTPQPGVKHPGQSAQAQPSSQSKRTSWETELQRMASDEKDPVRQKLAAAVLSESDQPAAWLALIEHEKAKCAAEPSARMTPLLRLHDLAVRKLPRSRRNDAYIAVYISYADLLGRTSADEGREMFKFLKNERVGEDSAALYTAWADLECRTGNAEKGRSVLSKGLQRKAQPLSALEAAWTRLTGEAVPAAAPEAAMQPAAPAPPPPQATASAAAHAATPAAAAGAGEEGEAGAGASRRAQGERTQSCASSHSSHSSGSSRDSGGSATVRVRREGAPARPGLGEEDVTIKMGDLNASFATTAATLTLTPSLLATPSLSAPRPAPASATHPGAPARASEGAEGAAGTPSVGAAFAGQEHLVAAVRRDFERWRPVAGRPLDVQPAIDEEGPAASSPPQPAAPAAAPTDPSPTPSIPHRPAAPSAPIAGPSSSAPKPIIKKARPALGALSSLGPARRVAPEEATAALVAEPPAEGPPAEPDAPPAPDPAAAPPPRPPPAPAPTAAVPPRAAGRPPTAGAGPSAPRPEDVAPRPKVAEAAALRSAAPAAGPSEAAGKREREEAAEEGAAKRPRPESPVYVKGGAGPAQAAPEEDETVPACPPAPPAAPAQPAPPARDPSPPPPAVAASASTPPRAAAAAGPGAGRTPVTPPRARGEGAGPSAVLMAKDGYFKVRALRELRAPAASGGAQMNGKEYIMLELLGRGGSSKVYKVMSPGKHIYALKRVHVDPHDPEAIASFTNEIELLRRLKGRQHIIQLVDAEIDSRQGLIHVLEQIGEIDLHHLLQRQAGRGLNENLVRHYWQQMLEAVHTIHEERIVHSDLKPANFLLVQGDLKLIDFGIARAVPNDTTNIVRENPAGTLNYMAPEAIDGGGGPGGGPCHKISRASDVWSLGCILYQMVYGKTPFSAITNMMAKMRAICSREHRIDMPPVPGGDPALADVLRRCLSRNQQERPSIPALLAHPFLKPSAAINAAAVPAPALRRDQIEAMIRQVAAKQSGKINVETLAEHLLQQFAASGVAVASPAPAAPEAGPSTRPAAPASSSRKDSSGGPGGSKSASSGGPTTARAAAGAKPAAAHADGHPPAPATRSASARSASAPASGSAPAAGPGAPKAPSAPRSDRERKNP